MLKKIVVSIFVVLLVALGSAAQTVSKIEQNLLAHLKNLRKYSEYVGSGDTAALERTNTALKADLIKYAANAATIKYGFKELTKNSMYITTSQDGKFRIYSWDTEGGGTAHWFESVFQYISSKGKARTWTPETFEGDACEPFYHQIFQTDTPGGRVYLANSNAICSTSLGFQKLSLFRIDGDKLDPNPKLIKTKSGLANSIHFQYDFFSVVDHPERPIRLFFYNEEKKSFRFPIVIEDKKTPQGRVTNRFIAYRFDGKYFVRV